MGRLNITEARLDITSRDDITHLVDRFYDHVRRDELLAPIFDDIAHVNWSAHLPRMYDFWESVLFGKAGFKGDPLGVHRMLAARTPLTSREFDRWVTLFHATVDDLFEGAMADGAKLRAARIAVIMQQNIAR